MPATAFSVNGVVELLPLDDNTLIAMERSFSVGAPGHRQHDQALHGRAARGTRRTRRLLLDLDDLGLPLDNVEGLTFGPQLHPRPAHAVLVSDNNFAATQFTQFLLFAVKD